KELGFTLNEIKELLSLRVDPGSSCEDVRTRAEVKIADIEEKIAALRRMRRALLRLTRACGETGGRAECPILDALDRRRGSERKLGDDPCDSHGDGMPEMSGEGQGRQAAHTAGLTPGRVRPPGSRRRVSLLRHEGLRRRVLRKRPGVHGVATESPGRREGND